jgi:hypothetical protein
VATDPVAHLIGACANANANASALGRADPPGQGA